MRRPRAPCRSCLPRSTESPCASRRCRSACPPRISEFFARLSPRTLAWSASLGAVALLLQAGVIGAVLMKNQTASFQTASLEPERAVVGAHHPRSRRQRRAAARAGAVRAGSPHRRHHRAARQLPGLDRRRRQGRHVPAAVRQQGDEQGRSRRPARAGCRARRSSASRWQRRKRARRALRRRPRSHGSRWRELADEDARARH